MGTSKGDGDLKASVNALGKHSSVAGRSGISGSTAEFCERIESAAPDYTSAYQSENHRAQKAVGDEEYRRREKESIASGDACDSATRMIGENDSDVRHKSGDGGPATAYDCAERQYSVDHEA